MQLTREEVAGLTGQTPATAEAAPEAGDFAAPEARIDIKEGEQPLAFGEMLGAPPEPEPKVAEPEGFVASSVASLEIPALEAEAAAAEPETPQWGGIESAPREPAPDEPPIKVEFGESEPLELVTDESMAASGPSLEIAAPAELATSATDFMEAAKDAAPPALLAQTEEEWVAAPPAAPLKTDSMEETQELRPWEVPKPAPPPAEPELVIAAPPVEEMAPPAAAAVTVMVEVPPPPAEMPPAVVVETPAVPQPLDPAVVDAVVEKVLARLQPQLMEQISRDIVRPLAEALLRKELEK
jgi:hypothetical protein